MRLRTGDRPVRVGLGAGKVHCKDELVSQMMTAVITAQEFFLGNRRMQPLEYLKLSSTSDSMRFQRSDVVCYTLTLHRLEVWYTDNEGTQDECLVGERTDQGTLCELNTVGSLCTQ
jgi:hypothetical protein